jgi:predicted SnoaL-like aldol condensation-catalyzing enzyme
MFFSCKSKIDRQKGEPMMSTETNKTLVRRYYEEMLNKRDPSLTEELFAQNYVYHIGVAPPNLPSGLEGFKQFVTEFLSGYTNLHFTIDDQIAEGDKVVTRVTGHSDNIGPLRGTRPASPEAAAKADSIPGISIERIVDNKIVESWGVFDTSAMYELVGVKVDTGTSSD